MKTLWTIVLGFFLLVSCSSSNNDPLGNWVKKSAFEGRPRSSAVNFVIGNKAYVGLGYIYDNTTQNGYLKDFWSYDPSTDSWAKIADFPGNGRTAAVSFSVNGKGYVGTGFDGNNILKDIWEYDPTLNKWAKKDDFIGGARYKAVGFALNNYGYIGTGKDDLSSDRNDFYRFDPTSATGNQWVKVQTIAGDKREGATAFTYNNKAYVCTGISNGAYPPAMYEYDPTADTWTAKIALNYDTNWTIIRQNASSFVVDGKAYVFLGEKSSILSTVWEYDFAANTWNAKTDFEGAARTSLVAFTVGGKAILATGQTGSYYLDDVWEFKPFEALNTEDNY